MSRIQVGRGVTPRLYDDSRVIEIIYTGNASASFDPQIKTSKTTSVIWKPNDAEATVTTGTTHDFSYIPIAGSHNCKITVLGGLDLVTEINFDADAVTDTKNFERLKNLTVISGNNNGSLASQCAFVSGLSKLQNFYSFTSSPIKVDLARFSNLPDLVYVVVFDTAARGSLERLAGNLNLVGINVGASQVSGPLSAVRNLIHLTTLNVQGTTVDGTAGVGGCHAMRTFTATSCNFSQSEMNTIIDDLYDNRASFTYQYPTIWLDGNNATPSNDQLVKAAALVTLGWTVHLPA